MRPYKDVSGNSKIESYKYNEYQIVFRFKNGEERDYKKENISSYQLDCLKARADQGQGLDEYIEELESGEVDK